MKTYRQVVQDLCVAYPETEARCLVRWLYEEQFGLSQTDLLLGKDKQLSANDLEIIKEITARLIHHEPIQYIVGSTTFCGHRFYVAPGALIPRPETEELVSAVLHQVKQTPAVPPAVLDIGTGSGCIALSLALALPDAQVTAWDVSEEALAVARENGCRYPQTKVSFDCVDILNPPSTDRRWDIIVSNPPYVRRCEACTMEKNVLNYEPHLALFVPDDNPLLFYYAISSFAMKHLSPDGWLFFEINEAFGAEISRLIVNMGFRNVEVLKDSYGKDRIVKTQRARQQRRKQQKLFLA